MADYNWIVALVVFALYGLAVGAVAFRALQYEGKGWARGEARNPYLGQLKSREVLELTQFNRGRRNDDGGGRAIEPQYRIQYRWNPTTYKHVLRALGFVHVCYQAYQLSVAGFQPGVWVSSQPDVAKDNVVLTVVRYAALDLSPMLSRIFFYLVLGLFFIFMGAVCACPSFNWQTILLSVSGFGPDFGVFYLEALFFTFVRFAFGFLACTDSRVMALDPSIACFSGAHFAFLVPGCLILLFYYAATMFWVADFRGTCVLALAFDTRSAVIQYTLLYLIAAASTLATVSPQVLPMILLPLFLALLAQHVWFQPALYSGGYGRIANGIMAAGYAGGAFVAAGGIAIRDQLTATCAATENCGDKHAGTFYAFVILLIPVWFLAFVLNTPRAIEREFGAQKPQYINAMLRFMAVFPARYDRQAEALLTELTSSAPGLSAMHRAFDLGRAERVRWLNSRLEDSWRVSSFAFEHTPSLLRLNLAAWLLWLHQLRQLALDVSPDDLSAAFAHAALCRTPVASAAAAVPAPWLPRPLVELVHSYLPSLPQESVLGGDAMLASAFIACVDVASPEAAHPPDAVYARVRSNSGSHSQALVLAEAKREGLPAELLTRMTEAAFSLVQLVRQAQTAAATAAAEADGAIRLAAPHPQAQGHGMGGHASFASTSSESKSREFKGSISSSGSGDSNGDASGADSLPPAPPSIDQGPTFVAGHVHINVGDDPHEELRSPESKYSSAPGTPVSGSRPALVTFTHRAVSAALAATQQQRTAHGLMVSCALPLLPPELAARLRALPPARVPHLKLVSPAPEYLTDANVRNGFPIV